MTRAQFFQATVGGILAAIGIGKSKYDGRKINQIHDEIPMYYLGVDPVDDLEFGRGDGKFKVIFYKKNNGVWTRLK